MTQVFQTGVFQPGVFQSGSSGSQTVSYDYNPAIDDILTEAWERCSINPRLIDAEQAYSARRSLQLILVDWVSRGFNLWQIDAQQTTLAATDGTTESIFTTPAGTSDVLEMWAVVGGAKRPMSPISRDQWARIPVPWTQSLVPTQFWCERVLPLPIIHVYPAPSAAVTIGFNRIRMAQDVTTMTQTADVPGRWLEALHATLAAKLALKFASKKVEMLTALAKDAYDIASTEDRERVPLTILPAL